MELRVRQEQSHFVADNTRSLAEAAYEEGLHTRAIYHEGTMIGFVLYDYDPEIPGWSMSRFMIGSQFQGRGLGKRAVLEFLEYFRETEHADRIFISVSVDNAVARRMYAEIGFAEIGEISYTLFGMDFREMRMVKRL